MSDALRVAHDQFAGGFNCAQSVFSAFAPRFDISGELAVRLAAPFGGGVGRAGEICGALSGALMILGLQYGQDRPEDKDEMYRIAREFMDQFRKRHGALRCRELIGHDISTPEGLREAREQKILSGLCPILVDETAKALERYLTDHPASCP